MSSNDTTVTSGPVSDMEVLAVKTAFYQGLTSSVLWGIQIALACQAIYLLWKRGLRNSLSRQCLTAIVLIMLASSTTIVILDLEFCIIQLPFLGIDTPPDIVDQMGAYNLAVTWLAKLNYCLSDVVVVWRAWALWPGNRPIRWTLGVFMGGTLVCMTVNSVLHTVQYFHVDINPQAGQPLYPINALKVVLYIPLLTTNALATILICYKAWLYRKDIQRYATDIESSGASSSGSKSGRVAYIFALFIETGIVYVIFFLFNVLCSFKVFEITELGSEFSSVWAIIMNEISAIYPTIVIILVSKYMSQNDVVYTSIHNMKHNPGSPENPYPGHVLDRKDENRTLSTIQFDTPRLLATTMSSSTHEDNDPAKGQVHESLGEKRAKLESV